MVRSNEAPFVPSNTQSNTEVRLDAAFGYTHNPRELQVLDAMAEGLALWTFTL